MIYILTFYIKEVELPKKDKISLFYYTKSILTYNTILPSPTPIYSYSTPYTLYNNKNITTTSINLGLEDSSTSNTSYNTSNNNNTINNTPIISSFSISTYSSPTSTTSKYSKYTYSNKYTAIIYPYKALY